MIKEAMSSGADCVKFQKSCLVEKFTKKALERPYQSKHSFGSTYGEHKSKLEFTNEQFRELKTFCDSHKIPMTASAMDPESVDFLALQLDVPFIKVGSGDVNNHFVLEKLAKLKSTNAVISTGMANLKMINDVYNLFKVHREDFINFVLLHCTSSYPTIPNGTKLKFSSHIINHY